MAKNKALSVGQICKKLIYTTLSDLGLNTMKYLGHPENDTNNFSYYSTQKPLSDDDLKTIIFAFSFRVLIIHHRDNSRRLTSQFILWLE